MSCALHREAPNNLLEDLCVKQKLASLFLIAAFLFSQQCFVTRAKAQAARRRIEVTAKRFAFTPSELTLKKGEPVLLVLKSEDAGHGIRVKGLGVDLKAAKGQTSEFTFTPDKSGDFVGACSTFCGSGHGSMKIAIHVVE
jgi:cytochrome c oxidase subunit II